MLQRGLDGRDEGGHIPGVNRVWGVLVSELCNPSFSRYPQKMCFDLKGCWVKWTMLGFALDTLNIEQHARSCPCLSHTTISYHKSAFCTALPA